LASFHSFGPAPSVSPRSKPATISRVFFTARASRAWIAAYSVFSLGPKPMARRWFNERRFRNSVS
jgi:hypothetical protein